MINRRSPEGKGYVSPICVVLAVLIAVLLPSCRQGGAGDGRGDAVHSAQVDSLLKDISDVDSLARLVQRYHDAGDVTGEILALKYQGSALRHQSRFDEAVTVHSRGLDAATGVNDTLEMIRALNNLGADYRRMGDLSRANGFHYKALRLCNAYSDQSSADAVKARVISLNGIGNIEIELRHYATADSVLRLALQGERALGSEVGMAINYSNLSEIKRAQGQRDSAWVYSRESLKHNQLADNEKGVALCHLVFGELYADERNFSRAQLEYKQAYDQLKEQGDTYHQLEACLSLAEVSILLGEMDEAYRYVREAEDEAERINSLEQVARANHLYYELSLLEGNPQRALDYYVKSDALFDSIFGLEKSNEMHVQRAEYEADVKQGEMSTLSNDIAHQKRLRNMMILFSVLLMVMAGAIIAALLYAARVRSRSHKLMRQVEETRSMFFTNVVHQLRTPLTAIMGATDAIVAQAAADPNGKNENVEIIEREGHHLLLLVDRILEVGSVRSAIKGPDWRTGDVVGYLRMIVESYREPCVARQIELTYAPNEREAIIDVVPDYLNTIVGSLLENAVSYSNDYGKITVTSQVDGDSLIIKVVDNGIGISEEDLPHVFNAFYRAAAAEQLCEGAGIGLTVVRDMVTVMGGSVDVKSMLGAGSVFTVTLPCRSGKPGEKQQLEMMVAPVGDVARKLVEAPKDSQPEQASAGQSLPVVLVVEDHNDVARVVGAALQPGYEVHYAANGEHGLARAKELIPDLIITDVKMPYMDGLELCRRVRASRKLRHVPVIMLSARTSAQDRIRGIEAGADVYMVKPFAAEEMRTWVSKLLENRQMLKRIYTNAGTNAAVTAFDTRYGATMTDEEFLDAFAWHLDRMAKDSAGRVDVDKIATGMKVGESYLRNRIMKLTGMKVSAYITQLRMEKAMDILNRHPHLRINEVAEQCGYSDVAYFSRVFRQYYKVSPTTARKQSQDTQPNG